MSEETVQARVEESLTSTHDMLLVKDLFPRMVIRDQGKVVADGLTSELMEDTQLLEAHGLERPY
jgi:energy-coupling factor transporter ATP-binding protein EcfA2